MSTFSDGILEDSKPAELTLAGLIGQAVGAASVCWEDMSGTGVFQDQQAREIVDVVVEWIEQRYESKSPALTMMLQESYSDELSRRLKGRW